MGRERYVPRPLNRATGEPFATAEEAWLWFARCQIARLDGVRFTAGIGDVARPCDPDDIYRAMDGLFRRRAIGRDHLQVLGRFGLRLAAPDPFAGDTPAEAALWAEALDRLAATLRGKGIVS